MRQGICNDAVSACLSVPSCATAAACGGFAAVGPAGRRYRSMLHGASAADTAAFRSISTAARRSAANASSIHAYSDVGS